jgi:hypothetical protein
MKGSSGWRDVPGQHQILRMMTWLAGLAIFGPGIFANLVTQPGLNPAFPVPFLLAHNLPHQGNLAVLVHIRVMG